MTDNDPISWRALVYGTPVLSSDGVQRGTLREVLGSDSEDLFHGIRVAVAGFPDVVVNSAAIKSLTPSAVTTDLSQADFEALPEYDETATYHLASVGWLRKHLGWTKDSESDEEPG
jgi:hypothetical protein